MYGSGAPHSTLNPLMGLNNATGDMVLNYVMAAVFIFLPLFWIGALSWAGFAAGGALQGLSLGTSGVKDAGAAGAKIAMGAAKG